MRTWESCGKSTKKKFGLREETRANGETRSKIEYNRSNQYAKNGMVCFPWKESSKKYWKQEEKKLK